MHLDFLEIGTCNFKTLLKDAAKSSQDITGLSVEPIKYYLDTLPNKKNLHKVNCAISANNLEGEVSIFYIPEKVVADKGLSRWVKGSSMIGDHHPGWLPLIRQGKIDPQTDVVEEKVKEIPIAKLLEDYNVESINNFKIDTEGSDCAILMHLKKFLLTKSKSLYPKTIKFESNFLTSKETVDNVIKEYKELGYILVSRDLDTVLKRVE